MYFLCSLLRKTMNILYFVYISQDRLLRNGTTTASYYGTMHTDATLKLCDVCGKLYVYSLSDGGSWSQIKVIFSVSTLSIINFREISWTNNVYLKR